MFGIKKTKKEVNGKNTYAVSFIGEDKMLGTDRDILTLRINSQIINFMNAYDHIDYYLAGMPAKNNTNLGLAACFQTNTLFRNRHIRMYYAVCAPRLSLKTRRNTCRQPKRRYFR